MMMGLRGGLHKNILLLRRGQSSNRSRSHSWKYRWVNRLWAPFFYDFHTLAEAFFATMKATQCERLGIVDFHHCLKGPGGQEAGEA